MNDSWLDGTEGRIGMQRTVGRMSNRYIDGLITLKLSRSCSRFTVFVLCESEINLEYSLLNYKQKYEWYLMIVML